MWATDAAQPGEPVIGWDDEHDVPAGPVWPHPLVRRELRVDLRGVLRRLVDLQAEHSGARVSLERHDAVGAHSLCPSVGGDRLGQPGLDRVGLDADERTDGGHDVELMPEVTDATEAPIRVPEPEHASPTQPIRDRDPTSDRQDRCSLHQAEMPQPTEVPERRSATWVDQRRQL